MSFFDKPNISNTSTEPITQSQSHVVSYGAQYNALQSLPPSIGAEQPQSSNGLVTPPISVANLPQFSLMALDTSNKRPFPWGEEGRQAKQQRTSIENNHITVDYVGTLEDQQTISKVTWQRNNNRIANVIQMPSQTMSVTQRSLPNDEQWNDQVIIKKRQTHPKLKLSDFHILRTLGTGSFGRVHLIQSRVNGRHYAVKVLRKHEVVRLKQVEHTLNEKKILESVSHPFLVNMWGTFQDDTNLYMVMDYIRGGELFTTLRKQRLFREDVAKFYAAEIFLALEYLHSKDIIYRDLKPENLLLNANGHIKIIDFGFAKHVPDVTWTLCGTPDYLAPEVIQSRGYSKAVDWWSFGVLIYELLAGFPPFYRSDGDHLKLYERILAGHLEWPRHFGSTAKDLLKRLITADLSKRYGNLRNGANDIRNHPWFASVDFNSILSQNTRGPNVPSTNDDGDTSYFDKYPEPALPYGAPAHDVYHDMFRDF